MTATAPTDAGALREAHPYGIIDPDYARVFTIARCLAWQEGYALVMHGSFTRDLDLLAAPWAEHATDAEHLVRRIELALDDLDILVKDPAAPSQATEKPHGRRAWTLTFKAFGDPRFVDLSVMPCATTDADLAKAREEIAGLKAALKPFAEAAADLDEKDADHDHLWESPAAMNLTAGDLRGACSALSDGGCDASR